jgi:hypothetical protein
MMTRSGGAMQLFYRKTNNVFITNNFVDCFTLGIKITHIPFTTLQQR